MAIYRCKRCPNDPCELNHKGDTSPLLRSKTCLFNAEDEAAWEVVVDPLLSSGQLSAFRQGDLVFSASFGYGWLLSSDATGAAGETIQLAGGRLVTVEPGWEPIMEARCRPWQRDELKEVLGCKLLSPAGRPFLATIIRENDSGYSLILPGFGAVNVETLANTDRSYGIWHLIETDRASHTTSMWLCGVAQHRRDKESEWRS